MSDEQHIWEAACEKVGVPNYRCEKWRANSLGLGGIAPCEHGFMHGHMTPRAIGDAEATLKIVRWAGALGSDVILTLSTIAYSKPTLWHCQIHKRNSFMAIGQNHNLPLAIASAVLEVPEP
jgi:hypothetical protein